MLYTRRYVEYSLICRWVILHSCKINRFFVVQFSLHIHIDIAFHSHRTDGHLNFSNWVFVEQQHCQEGSGSAGKTSY